MLSKNVNETVKKKGRLGCYLIDSGQTGKSIYTAICLVQYWLPLKVNATALKLTVSKVRGLILKLFVMFHSLEQMSSPNRIWIFLLYPTKAHISAMHRYQQRFKFVNKYRDGSLISGGASMRKKRYFLESNSNQVLFNSIIFSEAVNPTSS